jgi:hypothetical protein
MNFNIQFLRGGGPVITLGFLCLCAQWAQGADLDESIRKVRMGTLVVQAAPGTEIRVEQVRHEFWFGAALANQMFGGRARGTTAARYKEVFLENFNAAVTENALKWHSMERRKGEIDYSTVDAILAWTTEHDIPLRGHNVFWGVPNMVQPWLKQLDDATLRETLKARALDVARRYRGPLRPSRLKDAPRAGRRQRLNRQGRVDCLPHLVGEQASGLRSLRKKAGTTEKNCYDLHWFARLCKASGSNPSDASPCDLSASESVRQGLSSCFGTMRSLVQVQSPRLEGPVVSQ